MNVEECSKVGRDEKSFSFGVASSVRELVERVTLPGAILATIR